MNDVHAQQSLMVLVILSLLKLPFIIFSEKLSLNSKVFF